MNDYKLWIIPVAAIIIVLGLLGRDSERFEEIAGMLEDVVMLANEMREIHSFMQGMPNGERLSAHADLLHDHGEIAASVDELKSKIVGKTPEGWHRHDMGLWCEEFKELNPDINCPNPWAMPSYLQMIEEANASKD